MNKKILLVLIVILIVISIVLIDKPSSSNNAGINKQNINLRIGDPAPDFSLITTTSQNISLSDFKGKRAVIVNFWASWCYACINEMPLLQQASQNYKNELVVLGVNRQESSQDAIKFAYSLGVGFPLLLDTQRKVNDLYGVISLPVTYFINKEGVIVGLKRGEITKEELDNNIKNMI